MNRLQQFLDGLSAQKADGAAPALMTHVVLGYPTMQASIDIVRAMEEGGAGLVELQIPFSDPMADGPTIMHANQVALEAGVTPSHCMAAMAKLSETTELPLLFMSYFNLLFAYRGKGNGARGAGLSGFLADARDAGASGLIVPDVPLEQNREGYWTESRQHNLLPIPLVSPLTTAARMKKIAASVNGGFVYCVSTTGTTGARKSLPEGLGAYLKTVKRHFKMPRAVGFGISQPEHVNALRGHAHIAIVGSAMIDLIEKTPAQKRIAAVRSFTRRLCGK